MATSSDDLIGPGSEDKLDLVRKYLAAYATIMADQPPWCRNRFHNIDGFAGTGNPRSREEGAYVTFF